MAEIRDLSNPPIIEGLVDIRFDVPLKIRIDDLQHTLDRYEPSHPIFEPRVEQSAQFTFDAAKGFVFNQSSPASPAPSHLTRYDTLAPEQRTRFLSVQRDGITVSHLNKYGGWENLIETVKDLFGIFVGAAQPTAVIRLGARFINRISLPNTGLDFDDYLTCGPKVPPELPQVIFEFSQRTGIIGHSPAIKGFITQNLVHDPTQNQLAVLLDIDVFRSARFAPEWGAIDKSLEELHILKNQIFFGSLTERALKAYE